MCMHESLLDFLRCLRAVFFRGGYKLKLPCSQIHMTLVDGLYYKNNISDVLQANKTGHRKI